MSKKCSQGKMRTLQQEKMRAIAAQDHGWALVMQFVEEIPDILEVVRLDGVLTPRQSTIVKVLIHLAAGKVFFDQAIAIETSAIETSKQVKADGRV